MYLQHYINRKLSLDTQAWFKELERKLNFKIHTEVLKKLEYYQEIAYIAMQGKGSTRNI